MANSSRGEPACSPASLAWAPRRRVFGAGTGFVLNGDIDVVKVWRLNPHLVDEEFFSRPVEERVADC